MSPADSTFSLLAVSGSIIARTSLASWVMLGPTSPAPIRMTMLLGDLFMPPGLPRPLEEPLALTWVRFFVRRFAILTMEGVSCRQMYQPSDFHTPICCKLLEREEYEAERKKSRTNKYLSFGDFDLDHPGRLLSIYSSSYSQFLSRNVLLQTSKAQPQCRIRSEYF